MMQDWYEEELERERKYYARQAKGGELSCNAWRFNDHGSMAPQQVNMSDLWDAVHDYYSSREWN